MARRTREEIEQGRADILAVLEEDGPSREWAVVARVLGYPTVEALHQAWPAAGIGHVLRDLAALRRQGLITGGWDPACWGRFWRLSTDADVVVDEDLRDVERAQAGWVEA